MITDLDESNEYVDIYLYGNKVGATCNPSGVTQGSCAWYTCIGPTSVGIQATSSSLSIELRYSSNVNAVATCTDSGCPVSWLLYRVPFVLSLRCFAGRRGMQGVSEGNQSQESL